MRDVKRIKKFCDELAQLWEDNVPDWRFGQLMTNVLGQMAIDGIDIYFPEEPEMMDYLRKYFEKEKQYGK